MNILDRVTTLPYDSSQAQEPKETWSASQRVADIVFVGVDEILISKNDLITLFDTVILLSRYRKRTLTEWEDEPYVAP